MISPVFTSMIAPAAALALNFAMPFCKLVAQRVLDAQVDRELDRLEVGGGDVEAGAVEILQALAVDVFLDAGDADIVDIGEAEHVRGGVGVRIDALVLGQEADARDAEAMHLGLLARRDLALDPDEALLRAELVAQIRGVEVRQHGGQQLDRLVLVDDVARLGEDRDHLHVGGQHLAVAVDDVGPGRGNLGRSGTAHLARVLARHGEIDEPPADQR